MKTSIEILLASFLLLLLQTVAPSSVYAQDSTAQQQFVLMKNGHVIRGVVSKETDKFIVQVPEGSRLVLPQESVESLCDNLVDAYWQKAARTKASNLEGQTNLFQWCLAHNLLDQAQNQIDIISMMKIEAGELEYLHRQMTVAFDAKAQRLENTQKQTDPIQPPTPKVVQAEPVPERPPFEPEPPKPVEPTKVTGFEYEQIRELPSMSPSQEKVESQVVQQDSEAFAQPDVKLVGFSEPIKEDVPSETDEAAGLHKQVSIEELDELVSSLPKPSVAMFKRKIEPLLVRGCYLAGCHQSSAEKMPLTRLAKGQLIPRRLSQRNLHSILKYADPNEPLESRLLTAALKAHGGLDAPVIETGTVQFKNLATWLIAISNQPTAYYEMPSPDEATRALPPIELPGDQETTAGKELLSNDSAETERLGRHDPSLFNKQFLERDKE